MVRHVLICAALTACYQPTLSDCADRCDTSHLCPDGLTCDTHGDCRVDGASGACPADMETVDAGPTSCPQPPMGQGCTIAGPLPVVPSCIVACAATTGTTALAFTANTWHPVVVSDATKLAEAMTASGGATAWIGLVQPPNQPTPGAGWMWKNGTALAFNAWRPGQPDDGDGVEDNTEQCATMTGPTWQDEACSSSHVFLIEPF